MTQWKEETIESGSVWYSRHAGPFQLEVVQQTGETAFAAFILLNEREYRLPGTYQTLREAQLYLMQFLTSCLHQLLVRITAEI
jgi:hypothetical protein